MSEVVIYQMEDGKTNLEVQLDEETVWLNLNQIVALFGRDKSVVSRHINNIFREEELDRKAVVANFATTAADGKTYSDWKRIRASKVPSVRSIRHLTVRMSTPASRKRPLTYSTSSSRTMLFPTVTNGLPLLSLFVFLLPTTCFTVQTEANAWLTTPWWR